MKNVRLTLLSLILFGLLNAQNMPDMVYPSNTEVVNPMHKKDFNSGGQCPERKQGGNPQMINGYQVFNGSMDGNRQVDPKIAEGRGNSNS